MEIKPKHKVFLTGGSAGIGRATALLLAQKGYHVVLIGRHEAKLEHIMQAARALQIENNMKALQYDLTDSQFYDEELPKIWSEQGPFHILINNVGLPYAGVRGSDYNSLQYLVQTNLQSYLALCAFFSDRMILHNIEGDIINIGSMSANSRDAKSSGYVATKSGIQGFTEAFRKEMNPHNIRVALLEPGAVATDMQPQTPQEKQKLEEKCEMLLAEDIAKAILFVLELDRRVSISEMQIKPLRQFI